MISLKTINDFSEFLIEIFQKRLKEAIINDHEYTIVYFQFPNKMLLNCKNNKTKIEIFIKHNDISSIIISKNGFKKVKIFGKQKGELIDIIWDKDMKEFGYRRFEQKFEWFKGNENKKNIIKDF